MNGAQIVAKALKQYGVEYVFGVPGDTSMELYDAFYHQKELRHIVFRDERSAVYGADGYARISGRVGVVDFPSGGGALYAVGGISEIQRSSISAVCLSTDIALSSAETEALTELDQKALFQPITKWNEKVTTIKRLPTMLRKAFRLATSGRPGAVVLSLPQTILSGKWEDEEIIHEQLGERDTSYPRMRPAPPKRDLASVIKMLEKSSSPLILAGGGALTSGAFRELQSFSQSAGIPVATSINGKGSIPENLPLSVGVIGANGGKPSSNTIAKEADFLLVLGSKLNNVTTYGGSLVADTSICQVDISEIALENNALSEAQVLSDIKTFLEALRDEIPEKAIEKEEWVRWRNYIIEEKKRDQLDFERCSQVTHTTKGPITPYQITKALQSTLPPEAILVSDAGTPTPFISAYYLVREGGRRVISPRGHGGLGYAIPASIGAQLAKPTSPVIALFGDGSFGMSLGELETIARLQLPIILIHIDNQCYGWIKALQKIYHQERYFSVDFNPVQHAQVASAFGLKAWEIKEPSLLNDTFAKALASEGPVFINIITAPPTESLPPVAKWLEDTALEASDRKPIVY